MYPLLFTVIIVSSILVIKSVILKHRRTDKDPSNSRVFSQAKIFVPIGAIGCILMGLLIFVGLQSMYVGEPVDSAMVAASFVMFVISFLFLAYGLWRRFGVDHDKVWTKFGALFYREVRFDEVTQLSFGLQQFKVYAGGVKVNIDFNRFDYSLAFLRILEELQHRRFDVPKFSVEDPAWEEAAQHWRKWLAGHLYTHHKMFYDNNPQTLAYLNSLTETPAHYDN